GYGPAAPGVHDRRVVLRRWQRRAVDREIGVADAAGGDVCAARILAAHGAVRREPGKRDSVTAGRERGERDAAARSDRPAVAVHGDRVAIGIEVRAAGGGRYREVAGGGRDRRAGHRERVRDRLARNNRYRVRSAPAHAAVRRHAVRTRGAAGRGPVGGRGAGAVVGRARLAVAAVHGDRVAVGIEVRAGRARRHGETAGRGWYRRAGHRERGRVRLARRN